MADEEYRLPRPARALLPTRGARGKDSWPGGEATALAQGQTMVCTKGDDRGKCLETKGPDGKRGVVKGEGVKVGEPMTCVTAPGGDLTCTKVPVKQ